MRVRRRLVCCTRFREVSIDFDENSRDRIKIYDGLESCILKIQSYVNKNSTSGFPPDSFEEQASCSSSNYAFRSFYSDCRDTEDRDEWGKSQSLDQFYARRGYVSQFSEVEAMKEKFSKLFLGEDVTGRYKGKTSALTISNAITNLAASVYGELWKLQPLTEEVKAKWIKEMNWLLSPTNYMVELVPAKQSGTSGRTFEIMIPKARADVQINIPALQKLDSMLIEILDAMVDTEFWYAEGSNSEEEGAGNARQCKRRWLPYPLVPVGGLSEAPRKKLFSQGNVVHQVFKAAKSVNDNVLSEMTVPKAILDALPKSGRANLGEELYRLIASGSSSVFDIESLKLISEHEVLGTINKLEAASLAWKERIKDQVGTNKTPVRFSWSFGTESTLEADKIQSLLLRSDAFLCQLKMRYPCLPRTFLDVTKIQYGPDVGHAILESYSRVLANLAYRMLSRFGDILQEDYWSRNRMLDSAIINAGVRPSIVDQINKVDEHFSDSNPGISFSTGRKSSSVTASSGTSRIWCIGKLPDTSLA